MRGNAIKCYLDGALIHSFSLPVERQLYAATSLNATQDTLIVKIVNPSATDVSTSLCISNATVTGGSQIVLTANSGTAENTMNAKKNVSPKSAMMDNGLWTMEDGLWTIPYSAPAYSLSILKLGVTDITAAADITAPDASTVTAVSRQLDNLGKRFRYIHADTQLPTFVSDAKVEWSIQDETQYAQLVTTAASQLLHVEAPAATQSEVSSAAGHETSEAVAAGTLIATVTYEGGSKQTFRDPVHVAPADDAVGYLYAFMNSTQEITNFALGTKAGQAHEFNVLLDGAEVFPTAELARIEGGTRDAYLGRGTDRWPYVILTTDMCVARSGAWNNYGFDIIRSRNLMQWESTTLDFRKGKQIFSDPDAVTDAYTTDAAYSRINRVWAPQFVWDREAGRWLVYYSLLSSNSGDSYDKIYYSYTDDFESITQPRLFFDPSTAVIDADIFWNPYDSLYHMLFKREAASGSARGIYEATSPTLVGGTWTEVLHITFEGTNQVEAPTSIRRINEDDYTFTYMRYSGGSAYKYCDTDHLGLNPTASHTLKGTGNFQHGSILAITQDEWTTLSAWGQIRSLLDEVRALRVVTGSTVYDAAIAQAENALASDDIHAAATALPAAIQALEDAKQNNLDQFVHPGETTDFTSLLANPRFDSTGGWQGTAWTAIGSSGVAEQFNKSDFDDYQVLRNMPAGIYTFQSQGFYRNGSKSTAWNARAAGTEQLIPVIYIAEVDDDGRVLQETSTHYMSIYDESVTGYTFSPFTYPNDVSSANAAFNTAGHYKGNAAQLTLHDAGHLRVGIRKTGPAVANDWLCVDNFQLSLVGIPTGIAPVAITDADYGKGNYIYDISGRQLPAQGAKAKGIYIVRPAQGGASHSPNATKIIR